MKKNIRKLVAFALCLMIVFSVALTSSADGFEPISASKSFSVNGTGYIADITCDAYAYHDEYFSLSSAQPHTFGTRSWASYNGAYSKVATYEYTTTTGSDMYFSYVKSAGTQMGISQSVSATNTAVEFYSIEVPASEPTGDYVLGIRFEGYSGQWAISAGSLVNPQGDVAPAAVVVPLVGTGAGIISFAPTGAYEMAAFLVP